MANDNDLGVQPFKNVRIHFRSINACLIKRCYEFLKFYEPIKRDYLVRVPTGDGSIIWHVKGHLVYLSNKPPDPAHLCLGLDPIPTLAQKQNVQKGPLLGVVLFVTAQPWRALQFLSVKGLVSAQWTPRYKHQGNALCAQTQRSQIQIYLLNNNNKKR